MTCWIAQARSDDWTPKKARKELDQYVEYGQKSDLHEQAAMYLLVAIFCYWGAHVPARLAPTFQYSRPQRQCCRAVNLLQKAVLQKSAK